MTREGYASVSLPKEITDKVDRLVGKKQHGYRSRAQFFIDAAKELLDELEEDLLDDSES